MFDFSAILWVPENLHLPRDHLLWVKKLLAWQMPEMAWVLVLGEMSTATEQSPGPVRRHSLCLSAPAEAEATSRCGLELSGGAGGAGQGTGLYLGHDVVEEKGVIQLNEVIVSRLKQKTQNWCRVTSVGPGLDLRGFRGSISSTTKIQAEKNYSHHHWQTCD